jgi:hypothetical protein
MNLRKPIRRKPIAAIRSSQANRRKTIVGPPVSNLRELPDILSVIFLLKSLAARKRDKIRRTIYNFRFQQPTRKTCG